MLVRSGDNPACVLRVNRYEEECNNISLVKLRNDGEQLEALKGILR